MNIQVEMNRDQRYRDSMRSEINFCRRHEGKEDCRFSERELDFLCECYSHGYDGEGVQVEDLMGVFGFDLSNDELRKEGEGQMYQGHMDS